MNKYKFPFYEHGKTIIKPNPDYGVTRVRLKESYLQKHQSQRNYSSWCSDINIDRITFRHLGGSLEKSRIRNDDPNVLVFELYKGRLQTYITSKGHHSPIPVQHRTGVLLSMASTGISPDNTN